MDAEDAIGRRIARARKLRGLTQTGLAGRAHVSKSLIAQVESGHKPATPSLIAAVASALDADVTDLTGQPYRGTDARSDRIHTAIPQIRQALVYWDIPPILDVPPRPLDDLAAETERVNRQRKQASYVELGALLPALISELVVHAHQAREAGRSRAFRLLADAYTAVDSMAYKLGYLDLFALAVERMAWAARQADDPMLGPVAAIRRSAAFLATGAWGGIRAAGCSRGGRRAGASHRPVPRPPHSPRAHRGGRGLRRAGPGPAHQTVRGDDLQPGGPVRPAGPGQLAAGHGPGARSPRTARAGHARMAAVGQRHGPSLGDPLRHPDRRPNRGGGPADAVG